MLPFRERINAAARVHDAFSRRRGGHMAAGWGARAAVGQCRLLGSSRSGNGKRRCSHPGTKRSMSDYVISAGRRVAISRSNTGLQTTNGSDCCHWPVI